MDIRKKFFYKCDEALEQVAQRSGEHPVSLFIAKELDYMIFNSSDSMILRFKFIFSVLRRR